MARTSPPKPKAADRILSAAGDLFYRQGARAVGVDEVVSRAGVTKPSLYRAYGSKDGLIAAWLEEEGGRMHGQLDAAVAANPDDARAQLLAYVEALSAQASQAGYRGCPLSTSATEFPDPHNAGRLVAVAHKARLRERLRDIARAAKLRKPRRLADSLLLLIEGVHASSHLFGPEGPADAARAAAQALVSAHGRKASAGAEAAES